RTMSNPGEQSRSPASVNVQCMRELQSVVLFFALVCLLAVLPVFSLQATDGALFQPLAIAYVLAVLASTVVAFVVTPALSAILLSDVANAPTSPPVRKLQISENEWFGRIISRPSTAYRVIAAL